MRLSPIRFGFAAGATWGLAIFLITLIAIAQNQTHLVFDLISIYPGYEISLTGAALGFLWAFIDGFFGGYVMAWFYNAFSGSPCYTRCCGSGRCDDCGSCGSCGGSDCGTCVSGTCTGNVKTCNSGKCDDCGSCGECCGSCDGGVCSSVKKKTKPKPKAKKKSATKKKNK